jgi:glycosyltransferase involved in cell wall biosynthesis
MRVTALIPAFNSEPYVADALESVLEQTRKIDEVIVINDGSTDRTANVLATFGDRIHVIEQENQGSPAALNAGLNVATGDLLCFLDADDVWSSTKTELQASLLAADPSLDAIFGMVRQFAHAVPMSRAEIPLRAHPPQPGISKNAMMIRRASFDRVGAFDATLPASEFLQWYGRASMLPLRSRMLDEVVAFRRIHKTNIGRLMRTQQTREYLQSLKILLTRRRAAMDGHR